MLAYSRTSQRFLQVKNILCLVWARGYKAGIISVVLVLTSARRNKKLEIISTTRDGNVKLFDCNFYTDFCNVSAVDNIVEIK